MECTWDASEKGGGRWKFLRERKDKSFPNSYETATGNVTACTILLHLF